MAETVDDLVVIGRGRFIAQSTLDDFIGHAQQGVRVRSPQLDELGSLLAGLGATTALGGDGRLMVSGAEASAIGDLAAQRSIALHELTVVSFSLEEAVLDATAGSGEYVTMPDDRVPVIVGEETVNKLIRSEWIKLPLAEDHLDPRGPRDHSRRWPSPGPRQAQ